VVHRLEELIRTADLRPGDRMMTERELATKLGVSRTSIRQALTALRVRGIVEVRHGDGIYLVREANDLVDSLAQGLIESHAHLPAINEVREAVEPRAARLAARRRSDDDLETMRAALARMGEEIAAGQPGLEGDAAFHLALIAAAHNEVLTALYEHLTPGLAQSSQASLVRPGQGERSLREHERVLDAVFDADEEGAELAMRLHVRDFSDLEMVEPE
jgi:GntR family transcriptional regulator, transcriptional repressor for pyruvate dehydrogenase complex